MAAVGTVEIMARWQLPVQQTLVVVAVVLLQPLTTQNPETAVLES
jgi:hypothetical protein